MRVRAYIGIFSVATIAVFSAVILWRMLVDGGGFGRLGLAGVFLVAMLSHLTVVARDMFVPVFLSLTPLYNPLILGSVAGCGAALGEVTTYFLGWGVAESVREDQREIDDRVAGWISRYGMWVILLVSMTPLPDAPIVLLAGSGRMPFKKLLVVEALGKTTYYTFGAFVGGFFFIGLTDLMGSLYASVLVVSFSVVFCFLVTWKKSREAIFAFVERLVH